MKRTVQDVLDMVTKSVGETFVESVVSIHSERQGGDTPLHIVAKWGDVDAVRILAEAGALLDKPGEDGNTPLHYASMLGNFEATRCLVELGAKPKKDIFGNLPSQLATGSAELRAYLVQHGF